MQQINATLPTLGSCAIQFHKESAELLGALKSHELDRLNGIPHLGVASFAFTGLNHTRLEYMLLQCAVIGLLPKFNIETANLAISSSVRLAGIKTRISSGEELLKCWSILSNAGHMQYTYGVERSLLMHVQADHGLARLLVPRNIPADLNHWCHETIREFRYDRFRYVLILRRICNRLPSRSRLKGRLIHMLRNLLLPVDQLFPTAPVDRHKIFRLRTVFQQVRLLSMVTLDAYYSHHPIRYQIGSAIMDLSSLVKTPGEGSEFIDLMRRTSGFLADELYLHPSAVALQRAYEIRSLEKLSKFGGKIRNDKALSQLLQNARNNGFGKPKQGALAPLYRISFMPVHRSLLGHRNEHKQVTDLEGQLTNSKTTFVAVSHNHATENTHIDVLYSPTATVSDVGDVCRQTYKWLARALSAEVTRKTRIRRPDTQVAWRPTDYAERLLARWLRNPSLMRSIFEGIVRFLLPEGYSGALTGYIPRYTRGAGQLGAFPAYLKLPNGIEVDDIKLVLDHHLIHNPGGLGHDRLQELRALSVMRVRSSAPFLIACTETYVIRDRFRRQVDEWDGVLLEVANGFVKFTVVEAKNRGSRARNVTEAWNQLAATRSLIRSRHGCKTRRTRIPNLGAALTLDLDS